MIFDAEAMPLSRSWCLFELLQTLLLSQPSQSNLRQFQGLKLCTESGVLNDGTASLEVALSLASRLASLDLRNATASNPKDKAMIDTKARSMGGFESVNHFVKSHVHD